MARAITPNELATLLAHSRGAGTRAATVARLDALRSCADDGAIYDVTDEAEGSTARDPYASLAGSYSRLVRDDATLAGRVVVRYIRGDEPRVVLYPTGAATVALVADEQAA